MATKPFNPESESVQQALKRMDADKNISVGASCREDPSKISNVRFDESTLLSGDIIAIPSKEAFSNFRFEQAIGSRGNIAHGVLSMVSESSDATTIGTAKRLFFGTLKKRAVAYDEETLKPLIDANGNPRIVSSKNEFHDKVVNCPTLAEIIDLIAGKKLKFTDAEGSPVVTAQYDANRNIIGTRRTHVFDINIIED